MKMKTAEAVGLSIAIMRAQTAGKFAPAKFGFVLAVNAKELATVVESYEKSRLDLAEKHSAKDADGKPVMITVAGQQPHYDICDFQAFNAELQPVVETEVDVKLMTVALEDFPAEFDPALIAGLLPIIKMPDPATA